MSGGDYRWHQKINQAANTTLAIGTTGVSGATVLSGYTGASNFGFHIQIIDVHVTTGASGVTWSFMDSSGSNTIFGPLAMDTAGTPFHYDFGDRGVALPTGASLQISGSASGAGALVSIEGYRAYKGGASAGYSNASGASGTTV